MAKLSARCCTAIWQKSDANWAKGSLVCRPTLPSNAMRGKRGQLQIQMPCPQPAYSGRLGHVQAPIALATVTICGLARVLFCGEDDETDDPYPGLPPRVCSEL